ncbi:hypothetical protein N2K95_07690 [Arthrobacter zhaoxinii]|uniref:Uncharacterized protein n=1 Tax=Arthrobacter zhaoxinii TaxID=2964616 RepID=A0ABY5YTV1_9MICC|nr:hypothetical protein [Arthrobacter zhaoxinii]UWX98515.1 hypothetical protein N2K95_07690 [Arthrobacter zhaoxinii]
MSHSLESGGAPSEVAEKQITADARSAKKAALIRDVLYALALLICVGLTVYVLQNVPSGTRLPFSGRRGVDEISVPYAMIMPSVVMVLIWWIGKRRPLRPGKAALIRKYVFSTLIPLVVVAGQLETARKLIDIGALGG